jgi:uncharacterized protein
VIDSLDASLAATVTPAGDRALVALHGASEGTREFALYEHLHELLPAHGIGVVTFDRRGEGASTGQPCAGDFTTQVLNCEAVIGSLDVAHVALWGFSQGGWVAPLVAATDPRVELVVTIASCGTTPAAQMRYGVARHLGDAGFDGDAVAEVLSLRDAYADVMRGCGDEVALAARLGAATEQPWWEFAYLPASVPDPSGRARWVSEMDHDPVPSFAAVAVPVLAFYGEDDEWTPAATSAEIWRSLQGDNVEVHLLAGLPHDLTEPDGTVSPRYEALLVSWLSRHGWIDGA